LFIYINYIKFKKEMEKRNQQILERKRQSEQRRKEKEKKLKVFILYLFN